MDPEVIPFPSSEALERAVELVADKGAHIVAGAREGDASHLLTLDRKHLLTREVRETVLSIIVCTARAYLRALIENDGD